MADKLIIDCADGTETTVPLTDTELAQQQQDATTAGAVLQQVANAATVRQRAVNALATNATYLAITSPTNAQVAAQVQALTKECTGIIRLLLNQLDTVTGT